MKIAKITLSDADMKAVLRLTGETKQGTAIKVAVLQWLKLQGIETETDPSGAGGERVEVRAHYAGYNWAQYALSEGIDLDDISIEGDALPDFQYWCSEHGIEYNIDLLSHWCNGARRAVNER